MYKNNAASQREVDHWAEKILQAVRDGLLQIQKIEEMQMPAESGPQSLLLFASHRALVPFGRRDMYPSMHNAPVC